MNLLPADKAPPTPAKRPRKARPSEPQQRIVVPMPGLMPRLRQLAEDRKMPMAAVMRMAVLPLLEGGLAAIEPGGGAARGLRRSAGASTSAR